MLDSWVRRSSERHRIRLADALRGRRILITGASSGIGRAFALQVADSGAEAILVARRQEELERVAEEFGQHGGSAQIHAADLSDPDAAGRLAETILHEHGPVDVLVNNAGRSIRRALVDTKTDDFRGLVDVNYLGPVALTMGLLPAMLERGEGHIVQISTIGVQTGAPNFSAYVAAKAATDHFARTLRLELGGRGIRVTTIQVPLVRTSMMAPTRIYRAFPAQGLDKAANRIGRAVIRRPVRIAPWWATLLEVIHAVIPGALQWVFTLGHDPFHKLMAKRLERLERRSRETD